MGKLLRDNGLSLALAACFLITLAGQSVAGHLRHNEEELAHGGEPVPYVAYVMSSHFVAATAENWESEFLQMAVYVYFTIFLFQRGSAESKDPDEEEEVDREPSPRRKGAPWPVRRGGFVLWLYGHSLGFAFTLLFLVSLGLHAGASHRQAIQDALDHGEAVPTLAEFLGSARFWFESFQNWQSEFLAILSMVVLSVFLRQRGSPESKPVDAPHLETGSG